MLVSIITVTYNSEKFLAKTMDSVLNQGYNNIEYIIVDGQSTDGTLSLIDSFKSKFETKGIVLKVISEKDRGIYDAMNKGISMACGDLVCIINSDDWLENNAIQSFVDGYKNNDTILVGDTNRVDYEGKYLYTYKNSLQKLKDKIQYTMVLSHPSVCVPKAVYNKIGLFNLKYSIIADYDFIYRCYLAGVSFEFLNKPVVSMREGGVSDRFEIKSIYKRSKERYQVRKDKMSNRFLNFYLSAKFFTEEFIRQFILKKTPGISKFLRKAK